MLPSPPNRAYIFEYLPVVLKTLYLYLEFIIVF
jgi:hypothetical protein